MNLIKLALVSVAATGLLACSHPNSAVPPGIAPGPEQPPALKSIPESIQIDPQALTPLSDSDMVKAKALLTRVMLPHAMQRQILISSDESERGRSDRLQALDKLTAEQKATVQTIRSHCPIVENSGALRSSLTVSKTLHTSGAQCPVDLSRNLTITYTVITSDNSGKDGTVGISGTAVLHQQYASSLGQTVQVRQVDMKGIYRGLTQISSSDSTSYLQIAAQGETLSTELGPVQMTLKAESLGNENRHTLVYYLSLNVGGKDYSFASLANANSDQIETVEFYVGNRKLTKPETDSIEVQDLIRQF